MKFKIHLIFFPFSVLKEQCGILLKHPSIFKTGIPILYIFEHYQQK